MTPELGSFLVNPQITSNSQEINYVQPTRLLDTSSHSNFQILQGNIPFIAAWCCLNRSLHKKAELGLLSSRDTSRETCLLYGKEYLDGDAFLLHLCCLCRVP